MASRKFSERLVEVAANDGGKRESRAFAMVFFMQVIENFFDLGDATHFGAVIQVQVDQGDDMGAQIDLGIEKAFFSQVGISEGVVFPMMNRVAGEHGITVSELFTPFATVMNAMWEAGVAADALKQVDALIPMRGPRPLPAGRRCGDRWR